MSYLAVLQCGSWLFSVTLHSKEETAVWLGLGLCLFKMVSSDQDMLHSPLLIFGCITIYCFFFLHFSILEFHGVIWRSQHSARCSNKVKIWIMLITPRISHSLTVRCPPLTNSLLSRLSAGTHLVTLGLFGGVVLPTGPGQQDCAGCHCLGTFIPQSGCLTIEPCARAQQQAPQSQTTVCRPWNPRGLSERTTPSLHLL